MSRRALKRTYRLGDRRVDLDVVLDEGVLGGTLTEGASVRAVDAPVGVGDAGSVWLQQDGRRVRAVVLRQGDRWLVSFEGEVYELSTQDAAGARSPAGASDDFAVSPMTGLLAKVSVAVGQDVKAGAALFIVEAMKMEYVVKAPRDLVVAAVTASAGAQVSQGDVLVRFEEVT